MALVKPLLLVLIVRSPCREIQTNGPWKGKAVVSPLHLYQVLNGSRPCIVLLCLIACPNECSQSSLSYLLHSLSKYHLPTWRHYTYGLRSQWHACFMSFLHLHNTVIYILLIPYPLLSYSLHFPLYFPSFSLFHDYYLTRIRLIQFNFNQATKLRRHTHNCFGLLSNMVWKTHLYNATYSKHLK